MQLMSNNNNEKPFLIKGRKDGILRPMKWTTGLQTCLFS